MVIESSGKEGAMPARKEKGMGTSWPQKITTGVILVVALVALSGCSLLFGGGAAEEPTPAAAEDRQIVPTFTPTVEVPATATPEPTVAQVQVDVAPAAQAPAAETPAGGEQADAAATEASAEAPTEAAPTPTPVPKAVVSAPSANARTGPGTEYGLAGAVTQNQAFDVIGKNADGTWWQFCCVNGQQAWIFGDLVAVENAESVPVAQNVPAAPVAAAPEAPTAAPAAPQPEPAAPTNTPEPAPAEPAPAPAGNAVNAGGCGGDDGCKFKLREGPKFAENGGFEMKLQLLFIHSGVDGGQAQGDYRLGIERDGQLITVFADTTSRALDKNSGPQGQYNYEAKIGKDQLPGGTLEGEYFFWVLDGNRERDSDVFKMYVPPTQGEIYIVFDQG
jgi:hypothetical protein